VFCFDKTGTLTNNGLDFVGLQGVENTVHDGLQFSPTQSPWKHDLIDDVILRGFATCHAVTKFGAQFVGNEVEVVPKPWEMFE
jgi:magnesium-transporting ATPase (P-type)